MDTTADAPSSLSSQHLPSEETVSTKQAIRGPTAIPAPLKVPARPLARSTQRESSLRAAHTEKPGAQLLKRPGLNIEIAKFPKSMILYSDALPASSACPV